MHSGKIGSFRGGKDGKLNVKTRVENLAGKSANFSFYSLSKWGVQL